MNDVLRAQRPVRLPVVLSRDVCRRPGTTFERSALALSRSPYPASAPSKIPAQVQMAIGFPAKLNEALCRATLQPPFNDRDTELSRLLIRLDGSIVWRIDGPLSDIRDDLHTAMSKGIRVSVDVS